MHLKNLFEAALPHTEAKEATQHEGDKYSPGTFGLQVMPRSAYFPNFTSASRIRLQMSSDHWSNPMTICEKVDLPPMPDAWLPADPQPETLGPVHTGVLEWPDQRSAIDLSNQMT